MTTPNTIASDMLVEAVARGIERVIDQYPAVDASPSRIRKIRAGMITQAALTAITESGYAVVPREPELLPAGWEQRALPAVFEGGCSEIYRAMIQAAQGNGA